MQCQFAAVVIQHIHGIRAGRIGKIGPFIISYAIGIKHIGQKTVGNGCRSIHLIHRDNMRIGILQDFF
ncbi:MAG: hypothetical protein BWY70_00350 [Bacteroidetes bacterium ADurb.Bin408]|nr:MAG: hypothetical protein BWY70_00350 [Bacteroidetes bacterium ADurb.Bin408]